MPRPPRYPSDALLDAALDLYVDGGLEAVTMAGVARAVGAPSGSLYHRFSGRSELLARLWLRTVERFQEGYLEQLTADGDPVEVACLAVQHVLDWVRARPAEALLLARHSAKDLVGTVGVDGTLQALRRRLDARVRDAMFAWADRLQGELSGARLRFALVDLPLAAVRPYVQDGAVVPYEVDDLVKDALTAVLPTS